MTIQQSRQFCVLAEYEKHNIGIKSAFYHPAGAQHGAEECRNGVGNAVVRPQGRNIYLNHFGKDFYNFAKRTLVDYDASLEKFRVPHQDSEASRFCYSSAYIPDYVLPAFSADNPNIPITINEVEEKMIPHFIQNEIYDVAISSLK